MSELALDTEADITHWIVPTCSCNKLIFICEIIKFLSYFFFLQYFQYFCSTLQFLVHARTASASGSDEYPESMFWAKTMNQRTIGRVNSHLIWTVLPVDELKALNDPCPGMWPVWAPGAQVTGFRKRIIEHCYKQNIKALELMVSGKIFVCFSHCKYKGANVPWGLAILNPRGHNWQDLCK